MAYIDSNDIPKPDQPRYMEFAERMAMDMQDFNSHEQREILNIVHVSIENRYLDLIEQKEEELKSFKNQLEEFHNGPRVDKGLHPLTDVRDPNSPGLGNVKKYGHR